MKLYILTKDGALPQWAGTQAEAKSLTRELGCGWEWQSYDVPTSKDELLEFLNNCDIVRAATYNMVNAAVEEWAGEQPPAKPERGAELLAQSGDVGRIADWIMDTADQRGIERLFEALGARVGELRRVA